MRMSLERVRADLERLHGYCLEVLVYEMIIEGWGLHEAAEVLGVTSPALAHWIEDRRVALPRSV